jgi:hypothetical protein
VWRCFCSSSCAALCLFVVLCGACWFFVLVRGSFVQIDIFTSTHTFLMKTCTSMLQIWKYGYSSDFYFVIFVGIFMLPLYVINLGAARLFADSPFSIFSNLEFVRIYVFFNLNEFLFLSKKNKKNHFTHY